MFHILVRGHIVCNNMTCANSVFIIFLIVGVPGAPTCVRVSETTPSRTTLTWDKPETEAESPVTGYRLMIYEDTADGEDEIKSHDLPSNAKDFRVKNLDPRKTYIFKLAACNRSGFGAHASCE